MGTLERSAFKSLEDKNITFTPVDKTIFFLSEAGWLWGQFLTFRALFQKAIAKDKYILIVVKTVFVSHRSRLSCLLFLDHPILVYRSAKNINSFQYIFNRLK